MTSNLRRIARENGVEVTDQTTPNDIADGLRAKVQATSEIHASEAAAEPEHVAIPGAQFEANTLGLSRKLAETWARVNVRGTYRNQATGWDIEVPNSGIHKALSEPRQFPKDHIEAIAAVPELLKRAALDE